MAKRTSPSNHSKCEHLDDAATRAACEEQARAWDQAFDLRPSCPDCKVAPGQPHHPMCVKAPLSPSATWK